MKPIGALSELVDEHTVDILLPMLKHDKSEVRQQVTRLLLKMGHEDRVNWFAPEAVAEYRQGRFTASTR